MRLTCSGCGAHGSIELFTADEQARRFGELLSELPAGMPPAVARRYVALFRPYKRGLVWERACALLGEVKAMAESGGVMLNGQSYPASVALIANAMQQMLDKPAGLVLPLKSHGYLIAIVARGSGPEQAQTEEQTEQQRRDDSQRRHRETVSQEEIMRRRREELMRADARSAVKKASPS